MIEYNTGYKKLLIFRKILKFFNVFLWFGWPGFLLDHTVHLQHRKLNILNLSSILRTLLPLFLICPLHFSEVRDSTKYNRKQLNCFSEMK